jgi:integrase
MLQHQIARMAQLHANDLKHQCCRVPLPYAFERKSPRSAQDFAWFWVFASEQLSRCPDTGRIGRYHVDQSHLGRMVSNAARKAGIYKRVTCHTFRHTYATHHLNQGTDLPSIKELLGHSDIRITMIYTHVDAAGPQALRSPLEHLLANPLRSLTDSRRLQSG